MGDLANGLIAASVVAVPMVTNVVAQRIENADRKRGRKGGKDAK